MKSTSEKHGTPLGTSNTCDGSTKKRERERKGHKNYFKE